MNVNMYLYFFFTLIDIRTALVFGAVPVIFQVILFLVPRDPIGDRAPNCWKNCKVC